MFSLFLLILLVACFVSTTGARAAILAVLAIGFLQDPFRKLIPGEPAFLIVTVGLVFGVCFLAIARRVGLVNLSHPFFGWSDSLRQPITAFTLILAFQFLHSLLRYGNPVVSTIGLISYAAPLFAIAAGYFLVTRPREILSLMRIYVLIGGILAVTVLLSFLGFDHKLFEEVGEGIKIYDQGTVLKAYSGFMRTGEISAWHLGTAACFVIIIYFSSDSKTSLIFSVLLVLLFLGAIALTGRRKMLMLVSLFGVFYVLGISYYRKRLRLNYVIAGAATASAIWFSSQYLLGQSDNVDLANYIARGTSVYGSAFERALQLGLSPIMWAIDRVGFLGGGLGIGSQGSRAFGASSIAGGSGEGGLGKITVELGIPGLLIVFWLALAFAVYINRALQLTSQGFVPSYLLPLMVGITTMLTVNAMTFSVATQVYGDMFILLMLGLFAGFLFAIPRLVMAELDAARTHG